MNIVEIDVGARGREFFLQELESGGALSRCLRNRVLVLNGGRWTALLPDGASGDIYDFRAGGKFARGETVDVVGGAAVEVLSAHSGLVGVLRR